MNTSLLSREAVDIWRPDPKSPQRFNRWLTHPYGDANGPRGTIFLEPAASDRSLYMRVNDSVTYDVSRGHEVTYVGMTADGSKVFFTSAEQLTPEDHDTSSDLYMWSEATNSTDADLEGQQRRGQYRRMSRILVSGMRCRSSRSDWNGRPINTTLRLDTRSRLKLEISTSIRRSSSMVLRVRPTRRIYTSTVMGNVHFVASLTPGSSVHPAGEEETCGERPNIENSGLSEPVVAYGIYHS